MHPNCWNWVSRLSFQHEECISCKLSAWSRSQLQVVPCNAVPLGWTLCKCSGTLCWLVQFWGLWHELHYVKMCVASRYHLIYLFSQKCRTLGWTLGIFMCVSCLCLWSLVLLVQLGHGLYWRTLNFKCVPMSSYYNTNKLVECCALWGKRSKSTC